MWSAAAMPKLAHTPRALRGCRGGKGEDGMRFQIARDGGEPEIPGGNCDRPFGMCGASSMARREIFVRRRRLMKFSFESRSGAM